MGRVAAAASLAVLAAVALAGCSQGGTAAEDEVFDGLDLQVTDTTGLVRGVVVDEAIRPVANATVTLRQPNGAPDLVATTPATGAFAFDGLAPDTYFVFVAKAGFVEVQTSADVAAGVAEPPIVKVVLVADASFIAPFFEQFVFEGFIECSTGAGTPVLYAYGSVCSASEEVFPNDRVNRADLVSGYPDFLQAEMTWESTQAVSRSLAHNIYYADPSHADGNNDHTAEGESPLINPMNATLAKEYLEGLEFEEGGNLTYRQRIFTRATDGTGPALTVQQRFTVYTTVFYGYLPPEGWTFIATGEVPPPPPS